MLKGLFRISFFFIFNISLFAQESEELKTDNTDEEKIQNVKDKENTNYKNFENSIEEDVFEKKQDDNSDTTNEDIENLDIGDNVDMNLFNINRPKNFFIVNPISLGINGLLFSKGNWWHNGFNSFSLYNDFCKNIKEYKHKILFNNLIFSFDVIQYNMVIGKGFTFIIGLNVMWKNFLFMKDDEECIKYLAPFYKNEELDALKKIEETEENNKKIKTLEKDQNEYNRKIEEDKEKIPYSISLFNIGLLSGFGWYSKPLNLKKSWYIKMLIYARYQSLKEFTVIEKGKEEVEEIEKKYLRIKPFDLTCGLEIGYGKLSLKFFMSVLSLLIESKKYKKGGEEYNKKDNLFNCGFVIKFNIF